MSNIDVFLVGPEDLDVFWPEAGPLLAQAFEYTMGETDLEDIQLLIKNGIYNLIVVVDRQDDFLLAACVTEFCEYARKNSLKVAFLGSESHTIDRWVQPLFDFLELGGRTLGADYLEIIGRKGWLRGLPKEQGWQECSSIITRPL